MLKSIKITPPLLEGGEQPYSAPSSRSNQSLANRKFKSGLRLGGQELEERGASRSLEGPFERTEEASDEAGQGQARRQDRRQNSPRFGEARTTGKKKGAPRPDPFR